MGMEWTEHCAFGGVGWLGVIDRVDEQGETEDVGEKDEFLQVFQLAEK